MSHHEDDTLRLLAEQYRRDTGTAGWFAVGAASQALEFGNVARAQEILNAARALNAGGGDPMSPAPVPASRLTWDDTERLLSLVSGCRTTAQACAHDSSDEAKAADTDAMRALVGALYALVDWTTAPGAQGGEVR